jgi:hypothetical protein
MPYGLLHLLGKTCPTCGHALHGKGCCRVEGCQGCCEPEQLCLDYGTRIRQEIGSKSAFTNQNDKQEKE